MYPMRKLLLIAVVTSSLFISINASAKYTDTAEVSMKLKMEAVEKLVKELQSEVKTLKSANNSMGAEITTIKQALPVIKSKKLFIDRRGSKQAYYQ